ncbi:MAG: hypothetical protein IT529_21845 [Burkholderiales bacterium]|nr:hypothetical protein [Burkholderiales bacterium]
MLSDYQALAQQFTREDAGKIATTDIDRAIDLAVVRYSEDRERIKVEDLTPTDANTLPLPTGWETGFSALRSLEYPIGNVPPTMIDPARYSLYQSPASTVIKTLDGVSVAAAAVRASYTIKHAVTSSLDTIPLQHREPVACWAAASLCDQLATFYAGQSDSTMQADTVNHQSKSAEFSARARALRKRYLDELGVEEKRNAAAGVVVNLDLPDSRGQDRLTHAAAYR